MPVFLACIAASASLASMQERMDLARVSGMCRRCHQRMGHPGVSIHANMRLHPAVPLVAFWGLVHVRIALSALLLCSGWAQ